MRFLRGRLPGNAEGGRYLVPDIKETSGLMGYAENMLNLDPYVELREADGESAVKERKGADVFKREC